LKFTFILHRYLEGKLVLLVASFQLRPRKQAALTLQG
jgi:hypothetical protein